MNFASALKPYLIVYSYFITLFVYSPRIGVIFHISFQGCGRAGESSNNKYIQTRERFKYFQTQQTPKYALYNNMDLVQKSFQ